jgi:hypothetical protein
MIGVANSTEMSEVANGPSKTLECNFFIIDFSLSDPDFQSIERRNERESQMQAQQNATYGIISSQPYPLAATTSSPRTYRQRPKA